MTPNLAAVTERACAGAAFLATRAWTMGVATAEIADMMKKEKEVGTFPAFDRVVTPRRKRDRVAP